MKAIPAGKFKAKCLQIMDEVRDRRVEYVVTKRGKPVAKLVPMPETRADDIFGCGRGTGRILGDIITPILSEEEWGKEDWLDETPVERRRPARKKRAQHR